MAKRYVLLEADFDLTADDRKGFGRLIEQRYGKTPMIEVRGNERAVIIKTTNVFAARLKEEGTVVGTGGKSLRTVLMSGSIGKLKRRAGDSRTR